MDREGDHMGALMCKRGQGGGQHEGHGKRWERWKVGVGAPTFFKAIVWKGSNLRGYAL